MFGIAESIHVFFKQVGSNISKRVAGRSSVKTEVMDAKKRVEHFTDLGHYENQRFPMFVKSIFLSTSEHLYEYMYGASKNNAFKEDQQRPWNSKPDFSRFANQCLGILL